jgi:Flp pilus assembly protein TadG
VLIRLRQLLRRGRPQDGAVAVEFALILPILVFLVLGAMDLGHRFYLQHLITNASREGARFAAKYTGGATRTQAQVSDYVKLPPPNLNYNAFNLSNLTVTISPAVPIRNQIVTVTVSAQKHWWVLGAFRFFGFPGFTDPQTLTATTAMNVEGLP